MGQLVQRLAVCNHRSVICGGYLTPSYGKLHPRASQTNETEVAVEMLEWIAPAPATPDPNLRVASGRAYR